MKRFLMGAIALAITGCSTTKATEPMSPRLAKDISNIREWEAARNEKERAIAEMSQWLFNYKERFARGEVSQECLSTYTQQIELSVVSIKAAELEDEKLEAEARGLADKAADEMKRLGCTGG